MKVRILAAALLLALATGPPASATPLVGPLYPVPFDGVRLHGGNACFQTGGTPGSAAGTTWTFGAGKTRLTTCPAGATVPPPFDTTKFQRLYWGADGTATRSPRVAMDGAFTAGSDEILKSNTDSRPEAGLLVWQGTATFAGCAIPCGGSFPTITATTRLEVRLTTLAGMPIRLVDQAAAGINLPATVAVAQITPTLRNFRVNFKLLARNAAGAGAFEPAETFYNRYHHLSPQRLVSSFSGAFWYQNRLPVADFTYTAPQANVPVTFNATYRDPDGEIQGIGWDFNNDGSFAELDKPSGQWAFPLGKHVVRFRANDKENPAEYTVVRKTIDVRSTPTPTPTPAPPVIVPEAPRVDGDGDNYPAALDCNDANAAVNPGAVDTPGDSVDDDCVGGPAPPLEMAPTVSWDHKASRRSTVFTSFSVSNVPPGSTVAVRCKGKRCPKAVTRRNVGGTINLRSFVRRRKFAVNNTIEVRITRDTYRGVVKTLKIRSRKKPLLTTRCLAPGAVTPAPCS